MRSKLIYGAAGVGLVAFGALWGWAITADHYEQKLETVESELDSLEEGIVAAGRREERAQQVLATFRESAVPDGVIRDEQAEAEADLRTSLTEAALGSDAPTYDEREPYQMVDDNIADLVEQEKSHGGEVIVVGTDEIVVNKEEPDEDTRSITQRLIDQYAMRPEDRDEFANLAEKARVADAQPPRVIDQNEFAYGEEGEDYSKLTFTWYPREQILLDEGEDPVVGKEIDNMVGRANLNRFGDQSNDPNVVFIRNDRLEVDFEVVQDDVAELPAHVKFGIPKDEYRARVAQGLITE